MFGCGKLEYFKLADIAANGRMPSEKLVKLGECYYKETRVGYNRAYAAMAANQRVDTVVHCFNVTLPVDTEYVILEDGYQYRITLKQLDNVDVDLTLERLGGLYDVAE